MRSFGANCAPGKRNVRGGSTQVPVRRLEAKPRASVRATMEFEPTALPASKRKKCYLSGACRLLAATEPTRSHGIETLRLGRTPRKEHRDRTPPCSGQEKEADAPLIHCFLVARNQCLTKQHNCRPQPTSRKHQSWQRLMPARLKTRVPSTGAMTHVAQKSPCNPSGRRQP